MESQSWWEPAGRAPPRTPGPANGATSTSRRCFPLYQHFGGTGTIGFDITVRLHNFTGEMKDLRIEAYGDYKLAAFDNINWRCPTTDCERTFHADLPLDKMQYSGLHAIQIEAYCPTQSGRTQYTLPRWPVYLDNGKPLPPQDPMRTSLATMIESRGVITDSYFTHDGPGEKHAGPLAIARADFPWDPATGQSRPSRGVWQPTVFFGRATRGSPILDAALHADPPVKTVVYEGPGRAWGPDGFSKLRIDTTNAVRRPARAAARHAASR